MNFPYIIETYQNGVSGYRIWSNKFCEQYSRSTISTGNATITFLKPFIDTNYNFIAIGDYSSYGQDVTYNFRTNTQTNQNIGVGSKYSKQMYWFACGFIS